VCVGLSASAPKPTAADSAAAANKVTFARKNLAKADDSVSTDAQDVDLDLEMGARPNLVASYEGVRRSHSFADLDYADLLVIASVNNSAAYDASDPTVVIGDASETALLRFCDSFGVTKYYRDTYRIVHSVPFSSATKFSAVICKCHYRRCTSCGAPSSRACNRKLQY
jgi:magnesium-transporting ATPase (P-type)